MVNGRDAVCSLGPEDFRLLKEVINKNTGLCFDDDAAATFERRLGERLEMLGLSSFGQYYNYLRFNSGAREEIEAAADQLTVKETYFYRQEYQLRSFRDEILPELARTRAAKRRLVLWSAGCSTGEEAYTLAMLVISSCLFDGWDVRIVGSDISRQAVTRARRGVYREASFRTTPHDIRRRFFRECDEGYQVIESVRQMCHFGRANLLSGGIGAIGGQADVVFCRNVMIYFDARSKRHVIDQLYDRLVPGGYLFLGHSESLLNLSTAFELAHLKEDLAYRKPLGSELWSPFND